MPFLALGLFLWQNPLEIVCFIWGTIYHLQTSNLSDIDESQGVTNVSDLGFDLTASVTSKSESSFASEGAWSYFLSDLFHNIGYYMLWLSWVLVIDGLGQYFKRRQLLLFDHAQLAYPNSNQSFETNLSINDTDSFLWNEQTPLVNNYGNYTKTKQGKHSSKYFQIAEQKSNSNYEKTSPKSYGSLGTIISTQKNDTGDIEISSTRRNPERNIQESTTNESHSEMVEYPRHHPCSEYFGDFIWWKLTLFVVSAILTVSLLVCRYPVLFFLKGGKNMNEEDDVLNISDEDDDVTSSIGYINNNTLMTLRIVYLINSLLVTIISIIWLITFYCRGNSTRLVLKRQLYIPTRSLQLAYCFVFLQIFVIVLSILIITTIEFISVYHQYLSTENPMDSNNIIYGKPPNSPTPYNFIKKLYHMFRHLYIILIQQGSINLPESIGGLTSTSRSLGQFLLISFICYSILFIFLPARRWSSLDIGGGPKPHVTLEREFEELFQSRIEEWNKHVKGKTTFYKNRYNDKKHKKLLSEDSFDEDENGLNLGRVSSVDSFHNKEEDISIYGKPIFCLEIAYWLMEVSWQSYNDFDNLNIRNIQSNSNWRKRNSISHKKEGGTHTTENLDNLEDSEEKRELLSGNMYMENCVRSLDTDTTALLIRDRNKLIISFRGTHRLRNLKTDLPIKQTNLPEDWLLNKKKKDNLEERKPSDSLDKNKGRESRTNSDLEYSRSSSIIYNQLKNVNKEYGANLSLPTTLNMDYERIADREGIHEKGIISFDLSNSDLALDIDQHVRQTTSFNRTCASLKSNLKEVTTSISRLARSSVSTCPCIRQTLPRIHEGFWNAYRSIRAELFRAIEGAIDSKHEPIFFTGHSLGGALAILAAYDVNLHFHSRFVRPISVYTFGSPRVGNYMFAKMYNEKVPWTYRVTLDGDMEVRLPAGMTGTYKHTGIEVLIDAVNQGKFILNPSAVERLLYLRKRVSYDPHSLDMYRSCLESCFKEEDLIYYRKEVLGYRRASKASYTDGFINTSTNSSQNSFILQQNLGEEGNPSWKINREHFS